MKAFGLHKNAVIPECKIHRVQIEHIVLERYKRYEFPIKITVECKDEDNLQNVSRYLLDQGHKIVNSQYGNPYDCFIADQFEIAKIDEDLFYISCTGFGNRIPR